MAHSSSGISSSSGLVKPSSVTLKSFMLQSGQSGQSSSFFALSRHIKVQTAKDLGNALTAMKDSLYVTPKDPSSKLCCEAMAIVMKDMHLSTKKHMPIAMLIPSDISYAELMMGMIDASIDNDGEETNALYQYYNEITKDTDDGI